MVIIHDIMKKGKEKWDKPVSKKYYEGLKELVVDCLEEMGEKRGWIYNVMMYVDDYLKSGDRPSSMANPLVRNVFIMIRRDIDKAVARSSAARRRATERKKLKEEANGASTDATNPVATMKQNHNTAGKNLSRDGVRKKRAVEQRSAESDFVGIFDIIADGNPAGNLGDLNIGKRRKPAEDIIIGGFPIHGRTECKDYFFDLTGSDTLDKRID